MKKLYLVKLASCSIFKQLQIEEALLRADDRNWCLLNIGSSPAIVMGISGKSERLVDHVKAKERNLPIIRRFSGGGTVVVDHSTLFVSLICNESCTGVSTYPGPILEWNASLFDKALKDHGFEALENDYVLHNKKFGGNAQYLTKKRWLHHSSLLWNYQESLMDCLLLPPRMPNYRDNRSHHHFLCKLSDYLPSIAYLEEKIIEELHNRFEVIETPMKYVEEILKRPHRKATQWV